MNSYIENLKEMTLDALLSEWAIMSNATAQEWKGGDVQSYHEFRAKAEAVRAHILASFRHPGGESLADIRRWYAAKADSPAAKPDERSESEQGNSQVTEAVGEGKKGDGAALDVDAINHVIDIAHNCSGLSFHDEIMIGRAEKSIQEYEVRRDVSPTPGAPAGGTDQAPADAQNVCEHGDHPAPAGKRFCSDACARCEHESKSENGCDGICGRAKLEAQIADALDELTSYTPERCRSLAVGIVERLPAPVVPERPIKLRTIYTESHGKFDSVLIDSYPIGGGVWQGPREIAKEINHRITAFEAPGPQEGGRT